MFFGYFSTVGTVGSYVRCVWLFCCLRFDNSRDCKKGIIDIMEDRIGLFVMLFFVFR